jgi:ketosteroid isomerase-like protein
MTRRMVAVLAACVLLSSLAFAQTTPPGKKAAQAATAAAGLPDRALVQRVLDGWATLNTDNVSKYYDQAPGDVFYDLMPLKYVSFKAYAEGVKPTFATLDSLKFTLNDDLAVHGGANLAWMTATVKAVMTDKAGKASPLDCRWTAIWQKKPAGWVIIHDHFSAPMEAPK